MGTLPRNIADITNEDIFDLRWLLTCGIESAEEIGFKLNFRPEDVAPIIAKIKGANLGKPKEGVLNPVTAPQKPKKTRKKREETPKLSARQLALLDDDDE